MPYILDPIRRQQLEDGRAQPQNGGELNFLIAITIDKFLLRKGITYAHLNEAIGALECSKLEVYRRLAAPYEDVKAVQNGDVFHQVVAGL